MDNNSDDFFKETDRHFWEQPDNHALIKEHISGIDFFSILTLEPKLLMLLIDDFDYAQKLTKKMIEYGVRVFENDDVFYEWYNNHKTKLKANS